MNYNQDIINIYKNLAVITKKYPERLIDVLQCFNQNQYKCKTWLVDKLNKYPYVMYKTISDTPIKNADVRTLWNMIDKKRFFKIETSHYDYILENKLVANMADPHPSEEGHRRWANELKEFIDANNLLSI